MDGLVTRIVAIVGCVTGVAGLLVSFYQAISTRPKLRVSVAKPYLNGFTAPPDGYSSKHALMVNLRFVNAGVTPLSIQNAYIVHEGKIVRHYPKAPVLDLTFKVSETGYMRCEFYKGISFPCLLEAGAIRNATLVFPFADSVFQSFNPQKPLSVTVRVITGTRNIKRKVPVTELTHENIKGYTESHKDCVDD